MRVRVFLWLLPLWALSVPSSLPSPRWSIHTHPGLLAGLKHKDFLSHNTSPLDIVTLLEKQSFTHEIESFLDLCLKKGISEVIVDGVQPELAGIYFRSPYLEHLGWKPLYDVLELLRRKAGPRNIEVGISLSELGVHARGFYGRDPTLQHPLDGVKKLTEPDLRPFLSELVERYPLHSVTEEEFPPSWFPHLQELSRKHGFRYIHRAHTDDIVTLASAGQRSTPLEAYSGIKVLSSRDYSPLVSREEENSVINGLLPLIVPGHRRLVETSPWFSGRLFMENLILFRALDTAPEEVTLLMGPGDLLALSPDILRRASGLHNAFNPKARLLNLVVSGKPRQRLDPGHVAWLHLVANLEPILLGAQAAGLRPALTAAPLPEAAAYYVYLAGPTGADWIQLERILTNMEGKPVILQLGAPVSEDLVWRILRFLGVSGGAWRQAALPGSGFYRTQKVAFQGIDLYQGNLPTGYLDFQAQPQSTLMTDLTRVPMIYRHPDVPQRFFINGNLLNREMAFPISQLLADAKGLQKPATCLIGVGKRTAFWALQDTEVDWVHPETGIRLVLEMKKTASISNKAWR